MLVMDKPLVSVCIPTFQQKSLIADCLESVLKQETDFPFEIIVGEDASTDGTREICQELASKFPDKIRLFLREDQDKLKILGRKSGRRNYLENFKSAKGKYIATLDGDDLWTDPKKLQLQVNLLESHTNAFLCTTDYKSGKIFKEPFGFSGFHNPKTEFYSRRSLKKVSYLGHISNWVFRNELKDFLDTPAAEKGPILDLLLFSYFKQKGGVIHLHASTSFYRKNPLSFHGNKSSKANLENLFWSNWYQYRYIHHQPLAFLRFLGYLGKKWIRTTQKKIS
jgi:glycosyltransferase involved in cell wall biosynthesis